MAIDENGAETFPPDAKAAAGGASQQKPGSGAASKKPSALIDLKATEVEVREVRPDAVDAAHRSGAGSPTPAPNASAISETLTPPPASPILPVAKAFIRVSKATSSGAGAPAAGKPAGLSPSAFIKDAADPDIKMMPESRDDRSTWAASPSASAGPTPVPPPAQSSSGGLRMAATHLGAGLAGGLLALLGADALRPTLGLETTAPAAISAEVSRRLDHLEASVKQASGPTAELARKLAAAEARLGGLDEIGKSVATLTSQQTKLATDAKALADKQTQPVADIGAEARLAKLEDTLRTLSETAAGDPQRGRIPQLATLTGKLSDLESSLATQLAALRRSVTQEVDGRLSRTAEASEAARGGTQRLDRELATVKTEANQLSLRLDGVRTATERAELAVRGLRDEASDVKSAIEGLKGDIARELKQVARPRDVDNALSPVASRLMQLEENVRGVVKGEDDRRANAERIVLALELGNLKRALERGAPFAAELAEVRRVGGPRLDLARLEPHKDRGVTTVTELAREFRGLAHAIIDADAEPTNPGWQDRLLAGAKSIVRVRRVDQGAEDTGIEAAVARIEADIKDGKLADVAAEAAKLPAKALTPARGWLAKVEARATVERAVTDIESELKAALGAGAKPGPQIGKKG